MRKDVRERLFLPIVLPIAILAFIAAVLWSFSRILLGITSIAATATATAVALSIVVVAAVAAGRSAIRGSTIAAMFGATAGIAMLAGGIALAFAAGGEEAETPDHGGPPAGAVVRLAAQDIAFDPTKLSVPAGEPFTISFDNRDADTQHNVAIYDNEEFSGDPLFDGDIVTGPIQVDYDVDALPAGTYFFHCVVHPTMTGEIQVAQGGGGPTGGGPEGGPPGGGGPEGGGPGGAPTVVAQGIAFDTTTIQLPAGQGTSLTFDNRDAGIQHNIAIYRDDTLAENLFRGDIVTGPTTVDYSIPVLDAGEYYFQCDVHPNMNGTVTVA